MKNAKAILLLVLFGGFVMGVIATTIQEFTDGTTEGNFTFQGIESKYKNISIKEKGVIRNTTITLKGYIGTNFTFQENASQANFSNNYNDNNDSSFITIIDNIPYNLVMNYTKPSSSIEA